MSINLPDGTGTLYLTESAHSLRLWEAYGGARLELKVNVSADANSAETSVQLSGELVAGSSPSMNHIHLCDVAGDRLVIPNTRGTELQFRGTVSLAALEQLDRVRGSGPVYFVLRNLRAIALVNAPTPRLMDAGSGSVLVTVPSSVWAEEYERVTASTSFTLLVTAGSDEDLIDAVAHLNKAREHLRHGTVGSGTATEIRLALSPVRRAYDTHTNIQNVRTTRPMDRTLAQRWAVTIEDMFSLLSAYIHNDEEAIADAEFTRPLAVSLTHQVAGMLSRLTADRHAGLV